ncbi:MFS transporter [Microbacterium sp. NPDC089696]|uniref:MFS transporter n=1 Tax=Microbacterium sp. NPDC089696 TaxID=3364199 RepID=UPI00380075C0
MATSVAQAQTPEQRAATKRVVVASSIGTAIEWFDFALYGAATALVFGPLFFPGENKLASTLASFAVFAVAFGVRPIGGIIAAHIGDRVGRKPVLIFTVTLMGVATVGTGLLPTYDAVGVLAPVLLVLMRVLQGVGAGAEFAAAVTTVSEYAPTGRRAYFTSWMQASVGLAIASATGLFALLTLIPTEVLQGWAWRVPFIASSVIFVIAIFIRRRIEETPEFKKVKGDATAVKAEKVPLIAAFREAPRGVIAGFLCGTGLNVCGYLINTFSISYVVNTLEVAPIVGTLAVVCGTGLSFLTIPLWGRLADKIGYRKVFAGGAIFLLLYMVPYFMLLGTKNPALIILAAMVGYGVGQGAMLASQSAYMSELFSTRFRFSGITVGREINVALLGGTTPLIATALVAAGGGEPWLVIAFAAAALLVTIFSLAIAKPVGIGDEAIDNTEGSTTPKAAATTAS